MASPRKRIIEARTHFTSTQLVGRSGWVKRKVSVGAG